MNTVKYLFLGAALLGYSAAVTAQSGTAEDIDAVKAIIKSNSADLDNQLKAFQKKNKKNADILVGFGRAFYEAKDTARARDNAEMALKANKEYSPAFVLLGDIEAMGDNGGGAAQYYEQAIYFSPKDPEAYRKYASVYRKVSPEGAVSKLEDLRIQCPDYPVDALIGHINYLSGPSRYADAMTAYEKVAIDKMEKMDFIEYASAGYFTGKCEKALAKLNVGLSKYSDNATLNRLAMFCHTEMKNYTEALKYADVLFNKLNPDSASLSYLDYVYYGNALNGNKQHEQAIVQFEKALQQEFDNNDKKAGVIKTLSEAYKGKEDYVNAIKHYQVYLKEVSKASATDFASLGTLFMQKARTETGDAQQESLKAADIVYGDLVRQFPDAEDYGTFQRARVNMQLDPDSKQGLAKPYYEKLVELISPREQKDAADKARLIESYRYLINYHLNVADDTPKAKEIAKKLQEIDPANEVAKMVLDLK